MKKDILILIILAVIIIGLIVIFNWPFGSFSSMFSGAPKNQNSAATQTGQPKAGSVVGIDVTSPTIYQNVSSPITIAGTVNGGGWGGYEGQVGSVVLLDNQGKELAKAPLTATSDATKTQITFQTTITLSTKYTGNATLVFSNENPSGAAANNKIYGLPIVIK